MLDDAGGWQLVSKDADRVVWVRIHGLSVRASESLCTLAHNVLALPTRVSVFAAGAHCIHLLYGFCARGNNWKWGLRVPRIWPIGLPASRLNTFSSTPKFHGHQNELSIQVARFVSNSTPSVDIVCLTYTIIMGHDCERQSWLICWRTGQALLNSDFLLFSVLWLVHKNVCINSDKRECTPTLTLDCARSIHQVSCIPKSCCNQEWISELSQESYDTIIVLTYNISRMLHATRFHFELDCGLATTVFQGAANGVKPYKLLFGL